VLLETNGTRKRIEDRIGVRREQFLVLKYFFRFLEHSRIFVD
jgi:hypothetical protein